MRLLLAPMEGLLDFALRDTLTLVEDVFQANRIEFISTSEQIDTSSPSGGIPPIFKKRVDVTMSSHA